MGDWGVLGRIAENIGSSGLLIFVLYRLLDKWAGRFLDAQESQAAAMADLANSVKESSGEQRDVLMALRVLATKQEENLQWTKEIAANCARQVLRGCAPAVSQ